MVRTRSNDDSRECPICMEFIKYGAETNCGHLFCGGCILQVWDQNINSVPCISCPYCRQEVTMLLCCFTEAEAEDSGQPSELYEREQTKERLQHYNRFHSQEQNTYFNHLRELPTTMRHVWSEMFTWDGLQWLYKLRISLCLIVGVLYLLFPFDVLPEAILGVIGLIDDVMVVGFMLVQVSILFRANLAND